MREGGEGAHVSAGVLRVQKRTSHPCSWSDRKLAAAWYSYWDLNLVTYLTEGPASYGCLTRSDCRGYRCLRLSRER